MEEQAATSPAEPRGPLLHYKHVFGRHVMIQQMEPTQHAVAQSVAQSESNTLLVLLGTSRPLRQHCAAQAAPLPLQWRMARSTLHTSDLEGTTPQTSACKAKPPAMTWHTIWPQSEALTALA